ncbi:universal stress protein [Actinophytocola sp. NPDC049390]|uniref:universal stress protein n=1 Tax=Actinophytocola sp. NPDC049390 TaxID=3363894 RepID=UPI00379C8E80
MIAEDQHLSEHCDHPVVVGVDGSASALRAVRWAAREAASRSTPLRLVHVCDLTPVQRPHRFAPPREYHAAVLAQGRHWLNEASRAARQATSRLSVITDLRAGLAAEVLVSESRTAQLLVLGSRGLGGFRAMVVGSVAAALSAHGHCPVVVMRSCGHDSAPPEGGPVVVGADCSQVSDVTLAFAFEWAAAHAVPLVAVHTWLDVNMAGAWTALPDTVDWNSVQAEEEKRLDDRLSPWRDKFPTVDVRAVVRRDQPARALPAHADGAGLIVVGSQGRDAFAGAATSSVSQTLLHLAECPVVVARTDRT